ncbi:MAG: AMP-binding protein, partial [Butyricicoccus sp.]
MRKNVLEYLESSARMHADKPAFCDENRVFTFGELLKAAQGLGTHLAKTVDTLHKPVAVLIGRTAESVAAMQGVLYAGGCYVPIDDHMPEARIRRIFEQVHPVAIVYAEGNRKQAEPLADCAPLISMDEGFAAPADANLLQSIRESVLDIDPVY